MSGVAVRGRAVHQAAAADMTLGWTEGDSRPIRSCPTPANRVVGEPALRVSAPRMVWKRRARSGEGGGEGGGSVQQVRVSNHARSALVVDCLVVSEATKPPFAVRHRRIELPARTFVQLPVQCDVGAGKGDGVDTALLLLTPHSMDLVRGQGRTRDGRVVVPAAVALVLL